MEKSDRRFNALLGVPIETVDCDIGNCPIELNIRDRDRKFDTKLLRFGSKVKLIAPEIVRKKKIEDLPEVEQGQILNEIHIGHLVSKIIK